MVYQVPNFLLVFSVPGVEKAWRSRLAKNVYRQDILSAAFQALLLVVLSTRFLDFSHPAALSFLGYRSIFLFFILWVQRRTWYRAYRTPIVIINAALQSIGISSVLLPLYQDKMFPLASTLNFKWSLLPVQPLIVKSFVPIYHSLGFRLPLIYQVPLLLFTCIAISVHIDPRCCLECSTNPSYYTAMYTLTTDFFAKIKRLSIFGMSDGSVDLMDLSCRQNCDITQGFFVFYIGFFVPVLMVWCIEELDRLRFLAFRGGSLIQPKPNLYFAYSAMLLPFFALLAFQLLEVTVRVLI